MMKSSLPPFRMKSVLISLGDGKSPGFRGLLRLLILMLGGLLVHAMGPVAWAQGPASFVNLGTSARVTGLGGAFVALADDVTALYWNPAGLAQLERPAVSVLNRLRRFDTDYVTLTGALPSRDWGTFGLGLHYYGVQDVPMYNERGDANGLLKDQEGMLSLAYAFHVGALNLGASGQYLYQRMADERTLTRTGGWGVSAAALVSITEQLRVGVKVEDNRTLQDLDNRAVYEVETPLRVTTGLHWGWRWQDKLTHHVVVDITQQKDYPLFLNVGTEFLWWNTLALRGGVRDIPLERRGATVDYTDFWRAMIKPVVGLGIRRGSSPGNILFLDYALSIEPLGLRSFISLGYQF